MNKARLKKRREARQHWAATIQQSVGEVVNCPLCPEVTPEQGVEILTMALGPDGGHRWWNSTRAVHDRAARITGDPVWRERAFEWIDAYRAAHGHGPSWRQFWRAPDLWPAETTVSLLNTVMRQLSENGHLDGTKTPFGLRRREPQLAQAS